MTTSHSAEHSAERPVDQSVEQSVENASDRPAQEAPVPGAPGQTTGEGTPPPPVGTKPGAPTTRLPERKPEGPRRVRGGIKLKSRDGVIPSTPLTDALVRRIEGGIPTDERDEGVRYARLGQILTMQHDGGVLRARVQGSAPRPYEVSIPFGVWTDAQWDQIIEAMAAEAVYVVKLLADELPDGIDTLLEPLGLELLPGPDTPLVPSCPCGRDGRCRHAAALAYVFAEQLAKNPLMVFTLRGMPVDQLLERLRQTRTLQAHGVAAAHFDPMIPESKKEPPPLEMCVDEFWRAGRGIDDAQIAPPSKHLPHALLRRLGPSPLPGKFPLVGLLASIYDAVAEHAARIDAETDK